MTVQGFRHGGFLALCRDLHVLQDIPDERCLRAWLRSATKASKVLDLSQPWVKEAESPPSAARKRPCDAASAAAFETTAGSAASSEQPAQRSPWTGVSQEERLRFCPGLVHQVSNAWTLLPECTSSSVSLRCGNVAMATAGECPLWPWRIFWCVVRNRHGSGRKPKKHILLRDQGYNRCVERV